MSLPARIEAYDDCFDTFDAALADAHGYRVCFADHGAANIFMLRMHMARSLQRDLHKRIYPKDDPKWGSSEYDKLVVRTPRQDAAGEWWVYIERASSSILAGEPLSGSIKAAAE